MAISRAQLVKELEPGLNALFGLEYNRYDNEAALIFATIHATANTWRVLRVSADPENEDMTAAWCTVVVVGNLNQIIDSSA